MIKMYNDKIANNNYIHTAGTTIKPRMTSVCAYILSYLAIVGFAFFLLFAIIPYIAILIYPYVFIIGAPYLALGILCFAVCCYEKYFITDDYLYIFNRLRTKKTIVPKEDIERVDINYPSFCDCFGIGNLIIRTKSGKKYTIKYIKDPVSVANFIKSA